MKEEWQCCSCPSWLTAPKTPIPYCIEYCMSSPVCMRWRDTLTQRSKKRTLAVLMISVRSVCFHSTPNVCSILFYCTPLYAQCTEEGRDGLCSEGHSGNRKGKFRWGNVSILDFHLYAYVHDVIRFTDRHDAWRTRIRSSGRSLSYIVCPDPCF